MEMISASRNPKGRRSPTVLSVPLLLAKPNFRDISVDAFSILESLIGDDEAVMDMVPHPSVRGLLQLSKVSREIRAATDCTEQVANIVKTLPTAMAMAKCGLQGDLPSEWTLVSPLTDVEEASLRAVAKVMGGSGKKALEQHDAAALLSKVMFGALDKAEAARKVALEADASLAVEAVESEGTAGHTVKNGEENVPTCGKLKLSGTPADESQAGAVKDSAGNVICEGATVQLSVAKKKELWNFRGKVLQIRFIVSRGYVVKVLMEDGPNAGAKKEVLNTQVLVAVVPPAESAASSGDKCETNVAEESPSKKAKLDDIASKVFGEDRDSD